MKLYIAYIIFLSGLFELQNRVKATDVYTIGTSMILTLNEATVAPPCGPSGGYFTVWKNDDAYKICVPEETSWKDLDGSHLTSNNCAELSHRYEIGSGYFRINNPKSTGDFIAIECKGEASEAKDWTLIHWTYKSTGVKRYEEPLIDDPGIVYTDQVRIEFGDEHLMHANDPVGASYGFNLFTNTLKFTDATLWGNDVVEDPVCVASNALRGSLTTISFSNITYYPSSDCLCNSNPYPNMCAKSFEFSTSGKKLQSIGEYMTPTPPTRRRRQLVETDNVFSYKVYARSIFPISPPNQFCLSDSTANTFTCSGILYIYIYILYGEILLRL